MTQFTIEQKHISVCPCDEPDRPVIYLNTFEGGRRTGAAHSKRRRMPAVYACICQQS